jgi:RNA polymerase sigma-70 factor (ECF subfamily)
VPTNLPQAMKKAIDSLPDKYKTAFILRDIEEQSYEEVAKIMNIPLGTVKSRVNRARAMLRDKLKPRMEEYNALSKGTLLPVSLL